MPTTPQDRKPAKGAPFRFTDKNGKAHTLPLASKGKAVMTGRDLRDATVNGEVGQVAYLFKVLEAAGPAPAALEALYDLPELKAIDVLSDWAAHGDGAGASLGESKRSSN